MSTRLFGTVFASDRAAALLAAVAAQPATRPRLVVTTNLDHVISLSENAAFRKAYDGAAARTLDGMPLVWLARLYGERGVLRVTGHDLLTAAFGEASSEHDRIFLVCATARSGEVITERLIARGIAAAAVAAVVPPVGFEADEDYGQWLAGLIRDHGTTLLIIGVGAPKSEIWVDQQGAALGAPIVLAVGDALAVAAGLVPRAPVLMQRLGLEWLFRFAHAPRRLFRRYFVRSWRIFGIAWRTRPSDRRRRVLTGSHPEGDQAHSRS